MTIKHVESLDVKERKVFVRVDFNCPIKDGVVTDDTRIRKALPTIKYLVKEGARVILASHLGRPKGKVVKEMTLEPVGAKLAELMEQEVYLTDDCIGDGAKKVIMDLRPGQITLLENLRFHKEETDNDEIFAKKLASLADVYVNDAFGTAHRAHASTFGVPSVISEKAAGYLMFKEVDNLFPLLKKPDRPYLAILGGAKVSDKMGVLENLLDHVDTMLIGGGMAYTFLAAKGVPVGSSLLQKDKIEFAGKVLKGAKARKVEVLLPEDHVTALELGEDVETKIVENGEITSGMKCLDIGPKTLEAFVAEIKEAKTIFWNGPMGVFEMQPFAEGTMGMARAVAESEAQSIIGGGDSVAAVNKARVADKISHISTGGGASLEFLEGKKLPGISVLDN